MGMPLGCRRGDGLFQALQEQGAIGQTGQVVAKRLARDLRQQILVVDQDDELPGQHGGHQDAQRGEHGVVYRMARRVRPAAAAARISGK